jgi:hypothetical protein
MPSPWVACAVVAGIVGVVSAQPGVLPAPIPHDSGQGVTPSFEGWFRNSDGTISLSFGYFNRNYNETLDVAVGPDNRFEPGVPDRGQPTHFLTRRQTGVFVVVVPADFDGKLTWTLSAHGQTNSVPGHVRPEWEIDALEEVTSGNTPPVVRLEAFGPSGQGPAGVTSSVNAAISTPVTLTLWAADDGLSQRQGQGRQGPRMGVNWSKFRGPGSVTFGESAPRIGENGLAATTARFGEPGEYVLRALVWDASGPQGPIMAGGFQCCWTNGYVKVRVGPAAASIR